MTKTWARRTVQASAIAAGFLLVSAGAAQANGTDLDTTGNVGALSGNQAFAPVQAPIDICGNAVSVLGSSTAGCHGGATATMTESGHATDLTSTGNVGVGNGNQVYAPVQAPINVCGNSAAVLGSAVSGCKGGADATLKDGHGAPDATTTGNVGVGNGNQAIVPVQVPVDVSGNAATVGGHSLAGSHGGSNATMWSHHGERALAEALPGLPGGLPTAGVSNLPVDQVTGVLPTGAVAKTLPMDTVGSATGNLPTAGVTDGVTGKVTKQAKGVAKVAKPESKVTESGKDLYTAGNVGVGNGNQVYAPIQIPIDISGNAISVGGSSVAGSHGGSDASQR